jgi:hypothetical protein
MVVQTYLEKIVAGGDARSSVSRDDKVILSTSHQECRTVCQQEACDRDMIYREVSTVAIMLKWVDEIVPGSKD